MTCEELTPHFNKLVKIRLENKKRKTGWLLFNDRFQVPEGDFEEVICLDVHSGRKLMAGGPGLKPAIDAGEKLSIRSIQGIRSCL